MPKSKHRGKKMKKRLIADDYEEKVVITEKDKRQAKQLMWATIIIISLVLIYMGWSFAN